jgi:ferric-dicitrate binding protein FerR (iron transport regulator)
MSRYETTDGRLDLTRFELALQELEDGTLDPVERDELMALIARSPAAQRTYLSHFEVSSMLQAEAATHAEQGDLPKIARFDPPSRLFRRSLLAAAALLVLAAAVAALIQVARPDLPELVLTAAPETRWSVSGRSADADGQTTSVREGSTLRVTSGTLELRLESGAKMVVQGPAHVSFPKLSSPVLKSGWLWIDSGEAGEKFEVSTPDLRIRNVGTRFGVRVPTEGPAEVHLVEGKLEISSESVPGKLLELLPEDRGLAIDPHGEPAPLTLARDPFPEIAGLLAAPANYPNTVRGQNPVSYWRLDDAPDGRLQNEVPGEAAGRARSGVSLGAGPGAEDDLAGFDTTNQAARLDGMTVGSGLSLGAAPPRHQGVLFRDTFDGEGPLHQRAPQVTRDDIRWMSGHHFRANGWISSGTASATLAFQPVDGVVYTLDGSFRGVSSPLGDSPWVALGFASGQSTGTKTGDRFVLGQVTGRAWMLYRGTGSELGNTTLDVGASNPVPWENWGRGVGGDIDLRIILDTTRGYGNWTATWFARRQGNEPFLKVGSTRTLPNEAIRSVGIAVSGNKIQARITNLSLRADPETEHPAYRLRADGPAKLVQATGAVSCWLRRDSGSGRRSIVWSAGRDPGDESIHLGLESDGRIGFFMENGRFDVLLTSEEMLDEDRWHHLVASWSPSTVDLFLDGRRVGWLRESLGLTSDILPDFRVGGGDNLAENPSFTGLVDEVALWNRPLTPVEIEQQFRSARGK